MSGSGRNISKTMFPKRIYFNHLLPYSLVPQRLSPRSQHFSPSTPALITKSHQMKALQLCLVLLLLCHFALPRGSAGDSYDYGSIDPSYIGYGSSQDGIPRWDAKRSTHAGGFLGKISQGNWKGAAFEWIPGTNLVVWGSSNGLRLWDTETDTDKGFYNNATNGDWRVSGLALDPADSSRVIWTSSDGLQLWDTISNRKLGRFNKTSGNWQGTPIANHPTNSNYIIYISSGKLRVWDTVINIPVGPYGLDVDAGWQKENELTRLPVHNQVKFDFPLEIRQAGSSIVLSWSAIIGQTYQIQSGTRLWDFKDFGAKFVATANPTEVTVALTKPTGFFRVCK